MSQSPASFHSTISNALKTIEGNSDGPTRISLEPPSQSTPLHVNSFLPGEALRLLSFSDSKMAPQHFSPRLVHGREFLEGKIEIVSQERLITWQSVEHSLALDSPLPADGLVVLSNPSESASVASNPVRIGIRTADCLTWVAVGYVKDKSSVTTQVSVMAHLGWRSLAAGLHWDLAKRIWEIDQTGHFWKSAWHYLSPCIAPFDYPCQWKDVGESLTQLGFIASKKLPDAARVRNSPKLQPIIESALARNAAECSPDLRKLALIDLVCFGAVPQQIINHEVNTSRSLLYPSHRRSVASGQASQQRLLTLLEI